MVIIMNIKDISYYIFFISLLIVGFFLIKLLLSTNKLLDSLSKQKNTIDLIDNKTKHIQYNYQLLHNSYQNTKKKIYQLVPLLVVYLIFRRHYKNSNEKGISRIKQAVSETTKESIRINMIKM